jgi:hypothetical protein
MSAFVSGEPRDGKLTLNVDGTFEYEHYGNGNQSDEFRYRAFDGTGWSREARVRINVEAVPNNPPFVIDTPPDQEAVAGMYFQLPLAGFFADPDPGDTLTFYAFGLPGSRSLTLNATTGLLAGTPLRSDVRDRHYDIRVTAQDNYGASAYLDFDLMILEDNRADLEVTATISANPVSIGELARWEINIENRGPADLEEGELRARWLTSGSSLALTVPQGCTVSDNSSRAPSIRCSLDGLVANEVSSISVQGDQTGGGDNSLIALAIADDPIPGNNAYLAGASVVEMFSEGATQIIGVSSDELASADFNGDGMYDVVVATASNTVVYTNSGNRTLSTPGTSLGNRSGGVTAVTLDWNNDGHADIAVAGAEGASARVYLGDGSGGVDNSFSLNVSGLGQIRAAGAADLNGDGNSDLVLAGTNGAYVLRSNGGTGVSSNSLPGSGGIDVAIADIDNDTDLDIVLVAAEDRSIRLLKNSGNGRDYNQQTLQRGSVAGVTAADVNGDGDVDLLLAVDGEDLEPPESKVLIQRSDGSFPAGNPIGASPLHRLLAGDIDGDLVTDIIAVNDAGVHQVYRGVSGGNFELQPEQIVSDGMHQGILVDFNNDQSLDLILTGKAAGAMEIHANNGIGRLGLGDRIAPAIALNGETTLILASGEEYIEEGATATDDIDGDVTAGIEISHNINTAVLGTYSASYTVSDRAGNIATTIRTVQVGVNQGTGGGGGGVMSPWFLVLQFVLLLTLRQRAERRR